LLEEVNFYYVNILSNKNIKIHNKNWVFIWYSNAHTKLFLQVFLDEKSLIICLHQYVLELCYLQRQIISRKHPDGKIGQLQTSALRNTWVVVGNYKGRQIDSQWKVSICIVMASRANQFRIKDIFLCFIISIHKMTRSFNLLVTLTISRISLVLASRISQSLSSRTISWSLMRFSSFKFLLDCSRLSSSTFIIILSIFYLFTNKFKFSLLWFCYF